ncbi:MAG: flagellar motor stator protein MotA [Candidatus Kapabacteria bacterium]|nr:flagellar motor stator protein MotA [Candidatus Kapabacteria bacterium]
MFVIIGFVVVIGSVIGGFSIHGDLATLFQPTEFIIIGGAAIGGVIIGNTPTNLKAVIAGLLKSLKGANVSKKAYLDLLQMLYELFQYAKREGLIALEPHVEAPESSSIISRYPSFLSNKIAVDFLCDTLKIVLSGGVPAHDLDDLMELDLEAIHEEEATAPGILQTLADSLPGLGIVAAVLGIITTMSAINEGAEAVGAKVAGALVGTFLGVLLAYGFTSPLASIVGQNVAKEHKYVLCIKAALLSFAKGAPASVAIEYGRRAIDPEHRPTFKETEEAMKR